MIELKITGCCDGCQHIELNLKEAVLPLMSGDYHVYTLKCVHEKVCGAFAREQEANHENGDQ